MALLDPLSADEAIVLRGLLERVRECARHGKETTPHANARREFWAIQKSADMLHGWTNEFLMSEGWA